MNDSTRALSVGKTSVTDSVTQSANHSGERFKSSKDPLTGLIRDVVGGAGEVGGKLRETFTGRNGGGSGNGDAAGSGNGGSGRGS